MNEIEVVMLSPRKAPGLTKAAAEIVSPIRTFGAQQHPETQKFLSGRR